MKRIVLLLAVLMAGCAAHNPTPTPTPTPLKDWTITATWNYNFTNFVPCSATVTKGCISGFTWGYMQGSSQIPLKTSLPSTCTGSTQPEPCTDVVNSTVGIGTIIPYIVANGFDNTGTAVASSVDQGTGIPVVIASPTNIGLTLAP